ncbi:MAG: S-layer homology domain-containing protein, partial [Clostridia bacterium]|nr:S-layer homology domain-containing protein [Clostridia bacterium]
MKKILALVLALLMAVSTASMALATDTAAITEEAPKLISAATTYAEAIGMLDAYGIMKGVDPNTFDADADSDIQRYQMALFVGRISTGWTDDAQWTDGNVNNSGFTDLDGTAAQNFYGAISYASQKGIIEGYGDGKFGPTDGITYRDALTMVVRALGLGGGLKYPWGYIEKAEAIGLTKGITGVAYTDILNRGEVAQIIYNALSIPTTAGDTLGARYFGADLGWKTIIITATDRAAIDSVSKVGVPSGTVGFRVVKADGTLEDDTYYIAKEKLGIGAGAHDDEAQLGAAYRLLFTDDGTKLVKSLGEQKIFCGTTKNEGLFSKDADGKYPIEKVLANFSLTDKFTKVNYVNVNNWNAGLLILKSAIGNPVKTTTNKKYAIDWDNGNILVRNADGKIKDEEGNKTDVQIISVDDTPVTSWTLTNISGDQTDKNGLKYRTFDVVLELANPIKDVAEHKVNVYEFAFRANVCHSKDMELTAYPKITYGIEQVKYVVSTEAKSVSYNLYAILPDGSRLDKVVGYVGETKADDMNEGNAIA